jgi:hypothetical protein
VLDRFSNSWALVKASADVLRMDKELMIFPVFSAVGAVLVMVSFVAPLWITGGWQMFTAEGGAGYAAWVVGFLFYFANYFVVFFFNAALVGAALIRMDGGNPTVSDGLSLAFSRIGSILGYAALAATVGMVLRLISERSGFLGKLVAGLAGIAWTLGTYLAVPVLVSRNVGAVDAVKESAALFRKTWGEQVVGDFGLGWAVGLMGVSWTLASAAALWALAHLGGAAVLVGLSGALLGYAFLAVFASALKGVYTAALFRYAERGNAGLFDGRVVASAFRPR